MKFITLLEELKKGKLFETLCQKYSEDTYREPTNVECIGNMAYEDEDLYEFLECLGAVIEDSGVGFVVISTDSGRYYEVPYEDRPNRFDNDYPDETVLFFDIDRIYDVTEQRV